MHFERRVDGAEEANHAFCLEAKEMEQQRAIIFPYSERTRDER